MFMKRFKAPKQSRLLYFFDCSGGGVIGPTRFLNFSSSLTSTALRCSEFTRSSKGVSLKFAGSSFGGDQEGVMELIGSLLGVSRACCHQGLAGSSL